MIEVAAVFAVHLLSAEAPDIRFPVVVDADPVFVMVFSGAQEERWERNTWIKDIITIIIMAVTYSTILVIII